MPYFYTSFYRDCDLRLGTSLGTSYFFLTVDPAINLPSIFLYRKFYEKSKWTFIIED